MTARSALQVWCRSGFRASLTEMEGGMGRVAGGQAPAGQGRARHRPLDACQHVSGRPSACSYAHHAADVRGAAEGTPLAMAS